MSDGQVGAVGGPSYAEVHQRQVVVGADEDVGRLDVAVGDALAMGVLERVGKLSCQVSHASQRQRTLLADERAKRAPFKQLHDEVVDGSLAGDVEDLDDVRMAQSCGEPCLAVDEGDETVMGGEPRRP